MLRELFAQIVAIITGAAAAIADLLHQFWGSFLGLVFVAALAAGSSAVAGPARQAADGSMMICPPGYELSRTVAESSGKTQWACAIVQVDKDAAGGVEAEAGTIPPVTVKQWPPVMSPGAEYTVALCGPAAYAHDRSPASEVRFNWCVLYGNAVVAAYPPVGDETELEYRWWAAKFVADHVRAYGFGNPTYDVGQIIDHEIAPYLFLLD